MTAHRFLFETPHLRRGDACVAIEGGECHHLVRVLRARSGDVVWLTDGSGTMACGVVETCASRRVDVRVRHVLAPVPEPPALVLAMAVVERDRFVRAVEHCVALGCTRIVPLLCKRSRTRGSAAGLKDRLERVSVAAMKQSFRAHRARVDAAVPLLGASRELSGWGRVIVGDSSAGALGVGIRRPAVVVVGPEAGLSDDERQELEEAGAEFVSISSARLRTGTAAVALVSALARTD